MTIFKKVVDLNEIPVGHYIAYATDGTRHLLQVQKISNGTLALIDGHFWFDHYAELDVYAPFPPRDLE